MLSGTDKSWPHVKEIYDHKISAAEITSDTKLPPSLNNSAVRLIEIHIYNSVHGWHVFKVKEDGQCVSKCMYNILDKKGRKEVSFCLAEREGTNFWLRVLNDLKAKRSRGP
ncbi:mutator family transposase [Nephila pilipes]|uniref:Mutator family transposase n=1 Tax=Nephila pilipes TaxID=299642 RepID=A0A8X6TMV4_NEPPI|nr:mutator family transposase [Nephila pilipes]